MVVCETIEDLVYQLVSRVEDLETESLHQKQRIKELEEEVIKLKKDKDIPGLDNGNSQKRILAGTETEPVAFHATLDNGHNPNNHVGQILVFPKVKLNFGSAYNNRTGIFITPIPGIYIFSLSVMSSNQHVPSHVNIMVNGKEDAAAYAQGNAWVQGSVTTVLHLNDGDEIHVAFEHHDDATVFGDKLTSFMGCLIKSF